VPSLPLDDENLPLFTVGQVSIMLEVQQAFLRRLDEFGVVRPSRSDGGQRRYTRREITVVQYVVQLAGEGVSLAGIRRILELEAQVRDLERQCIVLQAQLRQIRAQAGRAALRPASGPGGRGPEASGPEASEPA
jgi:DNA-binding transcriptional MerR regulator